MEVTKPWPIKCQQCCLLEILGLDVFAAPNPHQNNGTQFEVATASQNVLGAPFGGVSLQTSPQTSLSQCPISQAQCEQLLNFFKKISTSRSGNGTQATH